MKAADGTMAFCLQKPAGFKYKAGQFLDVTLLNPAITDEGGNTRTFSIASAPHEKHLMVVTRMRDTAFKQSLKYMKSGANLDINGPFGSFTLHNNASRPAVFLVGGIGIAPVRSILIDAMKRKIPHKLYIFYSNRRPEDAVFINELEKLGKKNPNYKFVATMTEMGKSKEQWRSETGYISKTMLAKHIPESANAIYYIVGPAGMVGAMRKLLNEMGVDDDNIKTEEFSGY